LHQQRSTSSSSVTALPPDQPSLTASHTRQLIHANGVISNGTTSNTTWSGDRRVNGWCGSRMAGFSAEKIKSPSNGAVNGPHFPAGRRMTKSGHISVQERDEERRQAGWMSVEPANSTCLQAAPSANRQTLVSVTRCMLG